VLREVLGLNQGLVVLIVRHEKELLPVCEFATERGTMWSSCQHVPWLSQDIPGMNCLSMWARNFSMEQPRSRTADPLLAPFFTASQVDC